MLPRSHRLRNSGDFRRATRHGVRSGRPTLVVHAVRTDSDGIRVGFVVGRPVGSAVVRNRVKRRLRHLAAVEVERTPSGVDLVVRALPAAGTSAQMLASDLVTAWHRALSRLGSPAGPARPAPAPAVKPGPR